MDFLTKVKETVTSATKTAVDKSNELVEVTKVKFAVSEKEGEIDKLFKQIGEAVYNSFKTGKDLDESISSNCEEISKKYGEIDGLREKLREYKNISVCKNCNCEVSADSIFCNKCGEKITE